MKPLTYLTALQAGLQPRGDQKYSSRIAPRGSREIMPPPEPTGASVIGSSDTSAMPTAAPAAYSQCQFFGCYLSFLHGSGSNVPTLLASEQTPGYFYLPH